MRSGPFPVQQNSGAGSVFDQTFGTSSSSTESTSGEGFPFVSREEIDAVRSAAPSSPALETPNYSPLKPARPSDELSSSLGSLQLETPLETNQGGLSPDTGNSPAQINADTAQKPVPVVSEDKEIQTETSVIGIDGKPVSTAKTETAKTSVPARPPIPTDNAFDLSKLDSMWYWALLLLPIVAFFLFRFVTGTSSSDDLARYKYRGPKVENRDDPNLRGRFKKRPRSEETRNDVADLDAGEVGVNSEDADDDLNFLDDLPEPEESSEIPKPDLVFNQSKMDLSDSAQSAECDVGDELSEKLAPTDVLLSNFSTESNDVNFSDDSDEDLDFLMDDDEDQLDHFEDSADLSSDAVEPAAESVEEFTEEPVASDVIGQEVDTEFGLTQPASLDADWTNDDDFYDDDSDAGFTFDDEEEVVATGDATEDEDVVAKLDTDVEEDAVSMLSDEEPGLDTEESGGKLKPSAADARTAIAGAKRGSWFSRLFKGRKSKKATIVEVDDDEIASDSIAAVAVEEPIDCDATEPAAYVDDEDELALETVSVDTTVRDEIVQDSEEPNFSDSGDSFSLDDDDFSVGIFDDDSDAGYEFEPEEGEPDDVESIALEAGKIEAESAEFEAMFDETNENRGVAGDISDAITVNAQPDDNFGDELNDASDESEVVEPSVPISAGSTEDFEAGVELAPITQPACNDELPLLEDQFLDEIVDTEEQLDGGDVLPITAISRGSVDVSDLVEENDSEASASGMVAELQTRITELESQNAILEADCSSLKQRLEESQMVPMVADRLETEDAKSRLAELEEQLIAEQQSKEKLEAELAVETQTKQQAMIDIETAREETAKLKEEADAAKAEAADALAKAEEAFAAKAELERSSEITESPGEKLMAAAGGVVAGAMSADNDPFRLEPEQVKVMLKKLKTERKKRLKTKEYFVAAETQRQEVAQALQRVTGELESLKLEFEKVAKLSSDSVPKEVVAELKTQLDSAEAALKKKKPLS